MMRSLKFVHLLGSIALLGQQIIGDPWTMKIRANLNRDGKQHFYDPIVVTSKPESDASPTNKVLPAQMTGQDYNMNKQLEEDEPLCACGMQKYSSAGNRISGGTKIAPNEYPWIVRIDGKSLCTGSLISDRHILTAFHCMANNGDSEPFDHSDGTRRAYIGATYVSHYTDPLTGHKETDAVYVKKLTKMKYPPYPVLDRENPESHDLGVYELTKPIKFTNNVYPICLPEIGGGPYVGEKATSSGWGRYLPGNLASVDAIPKQLRKVELEVGKTIPDLPKMFVTPVEKNSFDEYKDPCTGDSGGPLMWQNSDNLMVILGTVHGGGYDCKKDTVRDIYNGRQVWNNVTAHLDWLKKLLIGSKRCY